MCGPRRGEGRGEREGCGSKETGESQRARLDGLLDRSPHVGECICHRACRVRRVAQGSGRTRERADNGPAERERVARKQARASQRCRAEWLARRGVGSRDLGERDQIQCDGAWCKSMGEREAHELEAGERGTRVRKRGVESRIRQVRESKHRAERRTVSGSEARAQARERRERARARASEEDGGVKAADGAGASEGSMEKHMRARGACGEREQV